MAFMNSDMNVNALQDLGHFTFSGVADKSVLHVPFSEFTSIWFIKVFSSLKELKS